MTHFPILYEDPSVLVVAKPAGMTVIPARNEPPEGSLHHALMVERGERLWVVHRLDRGTSGALVFARDPTAHAALCAAFERGAVAKRYRAFTLGRPTVGDAVIDVALHHARKGKMRPALPGETGSLASRTGVRVLDEWPTALGVVCHLEAVPETGRQHQVRVHLRWAGAPLLVAPLYGRHDRIEGHQLGVPGAPDIVRVPLHAFGLRLASPSGAMIDLECAYPNDLDTLLESLNKTATESVNDTATNDRDVRTDR